MNYFPWIINSFLVEARVSALRIRDFLFDHETVQLRPSSSDEEPVISWTNATFSWTQDDAASTIGSLEEPLLPVVDKPFELSIAQLTIRAKDSVEPELGSPPLSIVSSDSYRIQTRSVSMEKISPKWTCKCCARNSVASLNGMAFSFSRTASALWPSSIQYKVENGTASYGFVAQSPWLSVEVANTMLSWILPR